MKTVLHK